MQFGYGSWTGRHSLALDASNQLIKIANQNDDDIALLIGLGLHGRVKCYLGEIEEGRICIERSLDLYDSERHRNLALQYGQDPAVAGFGALGWILWILGYPEQARAATARSLELAQALNHPHTLCYALSVVAGWHGVFALAEDELVDLSKRLTDTVEKWDFWHWAGLSKHVHGCALALGGKTQSAIEAVKEGLTGMEAAGMRIGQPFVLTKLASICIESSSYQEGLDFLRRARRIVDETGECWSSAEISRVEGEIIRLNPKLSERKAEDCFIEAISVAKQQRTKMWEIRAATSLARVLKAQGKFDEAFETISSAYEWFSEGFDAPELIDAKALLDELA